MKVEQISVFLENKSGRLAEVTRAIAESGVNIRALSLADTSDFGILRLIVNDLEKTEKTLRDNGFSVGRTTVVGVAVPDRPGGLHDILGTLTENHINVEYMYAFVHQKDNNAIMIFRFDRTDQAIEVLQKGRFSIIAAKDIYQI